MLWAKYGGAVDYEQVHHRDFVNHSLVVPDRRDPGRQMTSFVLLSDVDEQDGPTKVVPLAAGGTHPYWPTGGDPDFAGGTGIESGAFADVEVSVTGPAGTLFTFRTDVLHRGSQITGERRARFALLTAYEVWGPRWTGRKGWHNGSLSPHWTGLIERATPRERELFGFPAIGDPYWNDQTLTDVQCRYPKMDMTPYAERRPPRFGEVFEPDSRSSPSVPVEAMLFDGAASLCLVPHALQQRSCLAGDARRRSILDATAVSADPSPD